MTAALHCAFSPIQDVRVVEKGYLVSFWVRKFAFGHFLSLRLASFSDVSLVQTIFQCTCAVWLRAYLPVACMRDTACYDADLIIDRQRQVSRCGTTHIQQAADGLRLCASCGSNVTKSHFSCILRDSFTPKHRAGLSCRHRHSRLRHLFGDFGECVFV